MPRMSRAERLVVGLVATVMGCTAPPLRVNDDEGLRAALTHCAPGTEIVIQQGNYRGGYFLEGIQGTALYPVRIRGADPENPPCFEGGGSEAWHFSDCSFLSLSDLVVRGYAGNGINVDDGGSYDTPSVGIQIERVRIEDTGPEGNHDALKMSGVDDFVVKDCVIRGWGGSAIDLVGCHTGEIVGCRFEGREGFSQASGVQIKGGSAQILVRDCDFLRAGERAINAGGSTGLEYFRPLDAAWEAEALNIVGNRFEGGATPVAVVSANQVRIFDNDIILPEKWALRILQETDDPRFAPCQNGTYERNRVRFDERVRTFVNVGPGTLPETFRLQGNEWIELGRDGSVLPGPRRPIWPPK